MNPIDVKIIAIFVFFSLMGFVRGFFGQAERGTADTGAPQGAVTT